MQQILQQLQQGTQEVVKDLQDGTLEIRINPPTALHLRAARVIVQVINERDQIINANNTLNREIHDILEENETLKRQIKELNDRLNSGHISQPETIAPDSSNPGLDAIGKDETSGSEAS
jgi:hypothetical protein